LVKKVIGEIESERFHVNKYINEEKRKELIDSTDPEKVAEIYAEIIYNYIKENYNINLENQKVQEDNVNS
jgi:GTP cyclohydrolase I